MITIPFIENNAVTLVIVGIIYLIDLVVRLWLLFYIPKKRKPTAAMAWLLLIFILPIIGTLVFLIMGSTKLSRKRRQAQQVMTGLFDKQSRSLKKQNVTLHPTTDPIMRLAHSLTGMAATTGNTAIILHGYDNIIDVMIQAIDTAEEHVLVEFYALALDKTTEPFFAALERARERGVAVYVLFDAWGSHKFPRKKEMKQRLTQMQARWRQALPLRFRLSHYNRPDLRNHRKIVVIDNRDAYIGSLNMVDKHYHRRDTISYIELAVHLTGPAVLQLGAVVLSDWYAETGELTDYQLNQSAYRPTAGDTTIQVIPSGSDYQDQNNLKAFVSLIYGARKSITITNPYLVPDESLLDALISAAKRGVTVSILNSEAMDQWMVGHAQRSYYQELLEAGVTISLYRAPQLVHEKFIVIDDTIGVVGSSNLDIRSFELNLECIVIAYDASTARTLHKHHNELLKNSRPITLADWKKRRFWPSLIDSITRLTSALQ